MEELEKKAEDILQPLLTAYNIPGSDVTFKQTMLALTMEALGNPAKEVNSIFEETLGRYEEVDQELPGLYKDQYLVTLQLMKYFNDRKKA